MRIITIMFIIIRMRIRMRLMMMKMMMTSMMMMMTMMVVVVVVVVVTRLGSLNIEEDHGIYRYDCDGSITMCDIHQCQPWFVNLKQR